MSGVRGRRKAVAVVAALLLAVATALVSGQPSSAAGRPPAAVTPLGVPFLPSPYPLEVSIDSLVAVSLTVEKDVTIRLSDGTPKNVTKYTFTKLKIRSHMNVTQRADGHTVVIDVPDEGSLGGYDSAGKPETTVMWGNISNVCVRVVFQICQVQGLLEFFGSFIPLTAGAEDFRGTIYAIRTTDDHAALNSTDNPVHLPGTITVTTP
ncbi:hypothetical protein ACFFSH_23240 [Streptomyces filamentosus]|uniref:hypothetical protein n=1 Tax=Streptomyces filamentosus TaxID=67294 RepID=UPI001E3D0AC6|nr:hypothetical protein [Streptomyces filamentosus]